MKAIKITVKIEVEVLSLDCLNSLLLDLSDQISKEKESGFFELNDGDNVKWETKRIPVEF